MEQTTEYRPVSAWAVAALMVGACSALAVVTRFAWVLPLIGVGLSVAALRDVARPGAAKAGRLLALAGLALAIGFGAQAVTAAAVARWIVGHRARAAATVWIDAVRAGRMAEAVGVSAPTLLPPPANAPGAAASDNEAEERINQFATLPAVRAVAACGSGRPTVLSATPAASNDGDWMVRVSLAECGGQDATLRLVVTSEVVRSAAAAVDRWTVSGVDLER